MSDGVLDSICTTIGCGKDLSSVSIRSLDDRPRIMSTPTEHSKIPGSPSGRVSSPLLQGVSATASLESSQRFGNCASASNSSGRMSNRASRSSSSSIVRGEDFITRLEAFFGLHMKQLMEGSMMLDLNQSCLYYLSGRFRELDAVENASLVPKFGSAYYDQVPDHSRLADIRRQFSYLKRLRISPDEMSISRNSIASRHRKQVAIALDARSTVEEFDCESIESGNSFVLNGDGIRRSVVNSVNIINLSMFTGLRQLEISSLNISDIQGWSRLRQRLTHLTINDNICNISLIDVLCCKGPRTSDISEKFITDETWTVAGGNTSTYASAGFAAVTGLGTGASSSTYSTLPPDIRADCDFGDSDSDDESSDGRWVQVGVNLREDYETKTTGDFIYSNSIESSDRNSYIWTRLSSLSVRRSGLQDMPQCLKQLTELRDLDLSHSFIRKVDNLQDCYLLQTLKLGFNELTSVENIYLVVGNIHSLILCNNSIDSTEGLQWLKALKSLDLSFNLLSRISEIERLQHLPVMVSLQLNDNPISYSKNYRLDVLIAIKATSDLSGRFRDEDLVLDSIKMTELERVTVKKFISVKATGRLSTASPTDVLVVSSASSGDTEIADRSVGSQSGNRRHQKGKRIVPLIEENHEDEKSMTSEASILLKDGDSIVDGEDVSDVRNIKSFQDQIERMKAELGPSWLLGLADVQDDDTSAAGGSGTTVPVEQSSASLPVKVQDAQTDLEKDLYFSLYVATDVRKPSYFIARTVLVHKNWLIELDASTGKPLKKCDCRCLFDMQKITLNDGRPNVVRLRFKVSSFETREVSCIYHSNDKVVLEDFIRAVWSRYGNTNVS